MLLELDIDNYAVVDKLRVRFDRGLNLLTGETGSGKSIVVDAFSLLFGARSDAGPQRVRRTGAKTDRDGATIAGRSPVIRRARRGRN